MLSIPNIPSMGTSKYRYVSEASGILITQDWLVASIKYHNRYYTFNTSNPSNMATPTQTEVEILADWNSEPCILVKNPGIIVADADMPTVLQVQELQN